MKKAQISVFVIVGIVLVLLVGAFFAFSNMGKNEELADAGEEIGLQVVEVSNFKELHDSCMRSTLISSFAGLLSIENSGPLIENIYDRDFENCLGLWKYEEQGYDVRFENYNAVVTVADNVITVHITHDLAITGKGVNYELPDNELIFDLASRANVNTDANGVVQEDINLYSTDRKVRLFIPKGTTALDSSGSPVKWITVKMVPRPQEEIMPPDVSLMLGPMMYRMEPDGVTFSPAVDLYYYYAQPGPSVNEAEFMMAYYSYASNGQLVAFASEVDTENNVVKSKVEHFSDPVPVSECGDVETYEDEVLFVPYCDFYGDDCFKWSVDDEGAYYYNIEEFEPKHLIMSRAADVIDYDGECGLVEPVYIRDDPGGQDDPDFNLEVVFSGRKAVHPELCDEDTQDFGYGDGDEEQSDICARIEAGREIEKLCGLLCTADTIEQCQRFYSKDDEANDEQYPEGSKDWKWVLGYGEYDAAETTLEDLFTIYTSILDPDFDDDNVMVFEDAQELIDDYEMFSGDGIDDTTVMSIADETKWVLADEKYNCDSLLPAKPKYAIGYEDREEIGGTAEFIFFFEENSCFDPRDTESNKITLSSQSAFLGFRKFEINGRSYPIPELGGENEYMTYTLDSDLPVITFFIRENMPCDGPDCRESRQFIQEGENVVEYEVEVLDLEGYDGSCLVDQASITLKGSGFKTDVCTMDDRLTYLNLYRTTCNDPTYAEAEVVMIGASTIPTAGNLNNAGVRDYYAEHGISLDSDMIFNCPSDANLIMCEGGYAEGCYNSAGVRDTPTVSMDQSLQPWFGEECYSNPTSDAPTEAVDQVEDSCEDLLGYGWTNKLNEAGDEIPLETCLPNCQLDTSVCERVDDETGDYFASGTGGSACVGGRPNGIKDVSEACDPDAPEQKMFCNQTNPERYAIPGDGAMGTPDDDATMELSSLRHCREDCTWNLAVCEASVVDGCNQDGVIDLGEYCDIDSTGEPVLAGATCAENTIYALPPASPYKGGELGCNRDCTYDFSECIENEPVICRAYEFNPKSPPDDVLGPCSDGECLCECKDEYDAPVSVDNYLDLCDEACEDTYGGEFRYNGAEPIYRVVDNLLCEIGECTDSDDTEGVKGVVRATGVTDGVERYILDTGADGNTDTYWYDYCSDGTTLIESYCNVLNPDYEVIDCTHSDADIYNICENGVCIVSTAKQACEEGGTASYQVSAFPDYTFKACCPDTAAYDGDQYCVDRDNTCVAPDTFRNTRICDAGVWNFCDTDLETYTISGVTYTCSQRLRYYWISEDDMDHMIYLPDGMPIEFCAGSSSFSRNEDGEACTLGTDCKWLCYGGTYYDVEVYRKVGDASYALGCFQRNAAGDSWEICPGTASAVLAPGEDCTTLGDYRESTTTSGEYFLCDGSVWVLCKGDSTTDPVATSMITSGGINYVCHFGRWTDRSTLACPYLYTYDGEGYHFDGTVITYHNGKDTESLQYDRITDYTNPVMIELREVEPETSYIDFIRLKVTREDGTSYYLAPADSSRDLNKIAYSDDVYLVTVMGDSVKVSFGEIPDIGSVSEVGVEVEGYYIRT